MKSGSVIIGVRPAYESIDNPDLRIRESEYPAWVEEDDVVMIPRYTHAIVSKEEYKFAYLDPNNSKDHQPIPVHFISLNEVMEIERTEYEKLGINTSTRAITSSETPLIMALTSRMILLTGALGRRISKISHEGSFMSPAARGRSIDGEQGATGTNRLPFKIVLPSSGYSNALDLTSSGVFLLPLLPDFSLTCATPGVPFILREYHYNISERGDVVISPADSLYAGSLLTQEEVDYHQYIVTSSHRRNVADECNAEVDTLYFMNTPVIGYKSSNEALSPTITFNAKDIHLLVLRDRKWKDVHAPILVTK